MSKHNDRLLELNKTGCVIQYKVKTDGGYGFIRCDDQRFKDDVFVYFDQIKPAEGENFKDKFRSLKQHQKVTFDLYVGDKGLLAKNVIAHPMSVDEYEAKLRGEIDDNIGNCVQPENTLPEDLGNK